MLLGCGPVPSTGTGAVAIGSREARGRSGAGARSRRPVEETGAEVDAAPRSRFV